MGDNTIRRGTEPIPQSSSSQRLGWAHRILGVKLAFSPRRMVTWRLPDIDHDAFHVYVVWSVTRPGVVLYVGRSRGVITRLGVHLRQAVVWREDMGDIDIYEFASDEEMEHGEVALIDRFLPIYNHLVPDVVDGELFAWRHA